MKNLKKAFSVVLVLALVFTFSMSFDYSSFAYAEDNSQADKEAVADIQSDGSVQDDQENQLTEALGDSSEVAQVQGTKLDEDSVLGDTSPDLIPLSNCVASIIPEQIYTGKAFEPEISITYAGVALTKDTDFTVEYQDNINAGNAKAVLTGIGNYTGTLTIPFKINPQKINPVIELSKTAFTYNGENRRPNVTVNDGYVLINSKNYTVTYPYLSKNAGTYTVRVTMKGNYSGSAEAKYKVTPKSITPRITLSKTSYEYNGKVHKPSVTVKYNGNKIASSKYKVTFSKSKPKSVGEYKVTIKMKGNYSGSNAVKYQIVPKRPILKSLTKGKNSITVKWGKKKNVSGYQIEYSVKSNFSKSVKKNASGESTVSKKLTGLTKGYKYYVRVRTYKIVSGKKYYSAWSVKKSTKVTKGTSEKLSKKPKIKISMVDSDDCIAKVKWPKLSGATGYQVYTKRASGSWKLYKTVTETSVQKNVDHGIYYKYKVRAYKEKADGSRIYGDFSKVESFMIYYSPNFSVLMSDSTDSDCSGVAMEITNNGITKMRIYSDNAKLIDHDYDTFDRDVYLVETDKFKAVDYIDIPAGSAESILWVVYGASTWRDSQTKIKYYFKYDGVNYVAFSSDYYGTDFYDA